MTRFRKLLLAMILATLSAPAAVLAAEAAASPPAAVQAPPAQAVSADPAERMALIRTIRARMYEIAHTQDAGKRKELMDAQIKDMEALAEMAPPGPGMGMGMMMGQGMGPGPMAGQGSCRTGPAMGMPGRGCNCPRAGALDQRLDALEKRLDMMQLLMERMARE
jgi:hypothetical protein